MKSPEQINKIAAVVLYILQHFKDGVDYIKLFKIMYFAQREYLATYGLTIAEDTFKARQLGPVPSLTYKVVKTLNTCITNIHGWTLAHSLQTFQHLNMAGIVVVLNF